MKQTLFLLELLLISTMTYTMEELLPLQDAQGNTPLHLAIHELYSNRVQELIASGADVNAQNSDGDTPLHLAYRKLRDVDDQEVTVELEELENKQKIIYLLQAGARINIKNAHGAVPYDHTNKLLMQYMYLPLIKAIEAQDNNTVNRLLIQGADPNCNIYAIPNNIHKADFLLSIALYNNNETAVRMLLDAHADPLKQAWYDSFDPGPMRVITIRHDSICQAAIKQGYAPMAQILLAHIPQSQIRKFWNSICVPMLCCKQIHSLSRDIRTLLCTYCIIPPLLQEQEERARAICRSITWIEPTDPDPATALLPLEHKKSFDENFLTYYHRTWKQQVYLVVQKRLSLEHLKN